MPGDSGQSTNISVKLPGSVRTLDGSSMHSHESLDPPTEPGSSLVGLVGKRVEDWSRPRGMPSVVPHADFDRPPALVLSHGSDCIRLSSLFSPSIPKGTAFSSVAIAGVADQVEEDASHVLRDDVDGINLRVQILLDVQVE